MSWRVVVIASRAKLEAQIGYLLVRTEANTSKVFLDEIATLLIENTAVSLTAALISELCERKINVIFCDKQRNPLAEVAHYYGCHNTSDRIRKQISWKEDMKQLVWTEIIHNKIQNQAALLKARNLPQGELLEKYVGALKLGDPANREGHAAKVYFNALFGKDFSRGKDCFTNAALDYGYAILLSAFNREICAAGYLTQLGIGHCNGDNRFNFGCDLMESFRPMMDRTVAQLKPVKFEGEERLAMVQALHSDVCIENRKQSLNNAIKIFCDSVFEALNTEDVACLAFAQDELSIYESDGII